MSATVVAREPLFRRPEVRFPARFLFVGVVLAVGWSVLQPTSMWLRRAHAAVVVWLSNAIGLDAAGEPGAHVRFADGDNVFRYVIDEGCTPLLIMAVYSAAVFAYPSSRRSRLLGVAAGLPVLLVVNLLRLVSLGWVGLHVRASFDAIHMFWWQVFFVAGTGLLWFAWAWWTSDARDVLSARKSVSLPRPTTTMVIVVGQLVAFAVLGVWAHGADLYYRLVHIPVGILVTMLWGNQVDLVSPSSATAAATYNGNYAQLAAVMALFLASPGLGLRTRLRGVVRYALPSVIALHVVTALWSTTVQIRGATEGTGGLWHRAGGVAFTLSFVLHIGISLVVWQVWLQQTHAEQIRRQARATNRKKRRRY